MRMRTPECKTMQRVAEKNLWMGLQVGGGRPGGGVGGHMGPRVQYFIFYSDLLHGIHSFSNFSVPARSGGVTGYLYNRAPG